MPVHFQHEQLDNCIYFITFTCIKWKCLFDLSDAYAAVYKWFDSLYNNNVRVNGYVIMPNHVHALLYFPEMLKSLNTVIGNGKRFIAYKIIRSLEQKKEIQLRRCWQLTVLPAAEAVVGMQPGLVLSVPTTGVRKQCIKITSVSSQKF